MLRFQTLVVSRLVVVRASPEAREERGRAHRQVGLHRSGVEWEQQVAGNSELQAGRENAPPDYNWSGLDYIFGPDFQSVDYTITIRRRAA